MPNVNRRSADVKHERHRRPGATNSPGEVTAAVRRFIGEGYAVGGQEHLAR
jgi:hypothetical protein